LNMGQPVLAYAPRGEVSKALASGLVSNVRLTGENDEQAEHPERRRRRGWPSRKSA
jgi:hypothetical protein